MTSSLQQELQTTGDFLALTRANEWSIDSAFSFEVTCKKTQAKSKVSVLDTGIIVFEPQDHVSGKDIVLSCAVHGNETAPIEICADLVKQLILGELHLEERVLFLFGNPAAINIGKRFVEENLNRLFSGAHSLPQGDASGLINKERHRALALENAVRDFFTQGDDIAAGRPRYHYDLHTAIRGSKNDKFAVYPFRHGKPWKKEQLQFMLACGVNTILLSHSPTTTFSYFSSNEFGADAFTVELGKVRPFGENDMANFAGVTQTLTRFISGEDLQLKDYNSDDFSIFEIYQTINREQENFTLHFADDVENFTDFPEGYLLATDGDTEHRVKKAGEAIIFPNAAVAIGQRALLTVIPTDID
ncbi:succinylglutamate desuccinylase [Thalassomonas viridans]|uniref:Succinylglutamate desuccinylase n=1 Tax=Thalassomonas viridans TaxID=137584 RepID=A0AAE9YZJ4_9GAMM|nr:succinylglutamate desuccinylase [Thalassomonas viridans]WDE03472.1 succinylglutamate desuccinylase [Thalassomonas viridans]